jgi:hypothetical protein
VTHRRLSLPTMSNAFRNKGGGHDRNCIVIRKSYAFGDQKRTDCSGRQAAYCMALEWRRRHGIILRLPPLFDSRDYGASEMMAFGHGLRPNWLLAWIEVQQQQHRDRDRDRDEKIPGEPCKLNMGYVDYPSRNSSIHSASWVPRGAFPEQHQRTCLQSR